MTGKNLEEVPHFLGVGQAAMRGNVAVACGAVKATGQRLGPRGDAKAFQKHPLGRHAGDGGATCAKRQRQRLEIDMAGGVRHALPRQAVEGRRDRPGAGAA